MIAISPESTDHDDNVVMLIRNTHIPECKEPPRLRYPSTEPGIYPGVFVGSCGDLWTIEIDIKAKAGVLRGGDIGWDRPIRIEGNRMRAGVVLGIGEEEFAWLAACWHAATGGTLEAPANLKALRLMRVMAGGEVDGRATG